MPTRNILNKQPNFTFKELDKKEQTYPKVSRKNKFEGEINKMESKKK